MLMGIILRSKQFEVVFLFAVDWRPSDDVIALFYVMYKTRYVINEILVNT